MIVVGIENYYLQKSAFCYFLFWV